MTKDTRRQLGKVNEEDYEDLETLRALYGYKSIPALIKYWKDIDMQNTTNLPLSAIRIATKGMNKKGHAQTCACRESNPGVVDSADEYINDCIDVDIVDVVAYINDVRAEYGTLPFHRHSFFSQAITDKDREEAGGTQ